MSTPTLPIFVPGAAVTTTDAHPESTFRWATVTDVDPLRVRLDGDTEGLPVTPATLVDPATLLIGSRVWVQLFGRRLIVLGRARVATRQPDPGWIAPTLTGSWVDYGSGWAPSGYRLGSDGRVHLRGLVKNGGLGLANPIFTLPEGYRPFGGTASVGEIFNQAASLSGANGSARVDVTSDGRVVVTSYGTSATNAYVSLAGISFYPAEA